MQCGLAGSLQVDIEGCGNQHIQFKTPQLLFEVVHDVEGGRTRAVCVGCWEKDTRPLEMKRREARKGSRKRNKSIIRWKNMTLAVEGDADSFACELLFEKCWKALDKGRRRGRQSRTRAKAVASVWQAGRLRAHRTQRASGFGQFTRCDMLGFQHSHGAQERDCGLQAQQDGGCQIGQVD